MFDSVSKSVVIDGVEYSPVDVMEVPVEPEPTSVSPQWWDFITSPRFWAMILGAFSIYGQQKGWLGDPEMQLVATISALFIGIKTIDRVSEKLSSK